MSRIISGHFPVPSQTKLPASISVSEASEPSTPDIGKWNGVSVVVGVVKG